MDIPILAIIIVAGLILLFIVVKIIKSCLPKIIFGLILLAGIGFAVYYFLTK
jgi:hypothetical protein